MIDLNSRSRALSAILTIIQFDGTHTHIHKHTHTHTHTETDKPLVVDKACRFALKLTSMFSLVNHEHTHTYTHAHTHTHTHTHTYTNTHLYRLPLMISVG